MSKVELSAEERNAAVTAATAELLAGRVTGAVRELMLYISKLEFERDQFKQIAALNAETIKIMQGGKEPCEHRYVAMTDGRCLQCGETP